MAEIVAKTNADQSCRHNRPIEMLLGAIETHTGRAPTRTNKGWRSRCPSCGGQSEKVSIAEAENGAVLLHAFCGCDASSVLAACGLTLASLFPNRLGATSPEARRAAKQAIREAGWRAAINVLGLESKIIVICGGDLLRGDLSASDLERARVAVERIDAARQVLA
jgi:hypothetical protein